MLNWIYPYVLLLTWISGFVDSHSIAKVHSKSPKWESPLLGSEGLFPSHHNEFKEIIGIELKRIPVHGGLEHNFEKHKLDIEHERELQHELLEKEHARKHDILEHERKELEHELERSEHDFLDHHFPRNILDVEHDAKHKHEREHELGILAHEFPRDIHKHKHFGSDVLEHELPPWEDPGFVLSEEAHRHDQDFHHEELFPVNEGSARRSNRREGASEGNSRRSNSNSNSNRRDNSNRESARRNRGGSNINTEELFPRRNRQNSDRRNGSNNSNNRRRANTNNNNNNNGNSRGNSNIEELAALEQEISANPESAFEEVLRPERQASPDSYATTDEHFNTHSSKTKRHTLTQQYNGESGNRRRAGENFQNTQKKNNGFSSSGNREYAGIFGSHGQHEQQSNQHGENNKKENYAGNGFNAEQSSNSNNKKHAGHKQDGFQNQKNPKPDNIFTESDEYLILDGPDPERQDHSANSRPGQLAGNGSGKPGNHHHETARPLNPSGIFFENEQTSKPQRPSNSNSNFHNEENLKPHKPPNTNYGHGGNSRPQGPSGSNFNSYDNSRPQGSSNSHFGNGEYRPHNSNINPTGIRPVGSNYNHESTRPQRPYHTNFNGEPGFAAGKPASSNYNNEQISSQQFSQGFNSDRPSSFNEGGSSGSQKHEYSSTPRRPTSANQNDGHISIGTSPERGNSRPSRFADNRRPGEDGRGNIHQSNENPDSGYFPSQEDGPQRTGSGTADNQDLSSYRPQGISLGNSGNRQQKPNRSGTRQRPSRPSNKESSESSEENFHRPNNEKINQNGEHNKQTQRPRPMKGADQNLGQNGFYSQEHLPNHKGSRPSSSGSDLKRPTASGSAHKEPSKGGSNKRKPSSSTNRPNQSLTNKFSQHPNIKLLPTDSCGIDLGNKIIGGTNTQLDEFPWMALLQHTTDNGRSLGFGCGGSLISSRYVLTAAHCIEGPTMSNSIRVTKVRLGEFDTSSEIDCQGDICSDAPVDVAVESVIVHPNYTPTDRAQIHDIALIRLQENVQTSAYISPICLPFHESSQNITGERFTVAGWGKTANGQNGKSSKTKQKVSIPGVSLHECAQFYRRINIELRDTQMCAGGEKGKDSCQGDSGGPLMSSQAVDNQIRWQVRGVVSFGPQDCGIDKVAGVYTKVWDYIPWILDTIKS